MSGAAFKRGRNVLTKLQRTLSRSALTLFLVRGVVSAAALAGDLSKYRQFQLGTDLPTVAKQAGMNLLQVKVVHLRPALIQELEWQRQPIDTTSQSERTRDVFFNFYNGRLYQIAVSYDRYETEGMTPDDLVEAISVTYGVATRPAILAPPVEPAEGRYGESDQLIAQWQDSEYRFELIRSAYGPAYKLVGVLKSLEAPVQAATLEAARLDDKEAPQIEANRVAKEAEAERARLEKARLVNKPKFRP